MTDLIVVHRGSYHDSARLMAIAREIAAVPGVIAAEAMMGTEANRALLAQAGFAGPDVDSATPLDLVIALRSKRLGGLAEAQERLAHLLSGGGEVASRAAAVRPGTVAEAIVAAPAANLVSIAVPGPYAAFLAHRTLDAGRHVFLFSDNVPLADEVALKTRGRDLGLLVMGPDCGTAIIAGVGLGFANRVPRGPVGIVGASGTGTQEVCCALARAGIGVSHAIGTGSRDLSAAVGGIMTEMGARLLAEDGATRAVAVIAKHPDAAVAERLHGVLASLGKRVVVRYLGEPGRPERDGVAYAGSLDEAAELLAAIVAAPAGQVGASTPSRPVLAAGETGAPLPFVSPRPEVASDDARVRGRLVGLFGGGSLAAEAGHVLAGAGIAVTLPERPLRPDQPIPPGHLIVDTGDDAYTVGRPHPMVDQTVRCALIRAAGHDRSVGLVLLDLVLGDGAHPDPAPEIAAAVAGARAARGGTRLEVVCSLCASPADPQDPARQEAVLLRAGVRVAPTAAQAARLAADLLERRPQGGVR